MSQAEIRSVFVCATNFVKSDISPIALLGHFNAMLKLFPIKLEEASLLYAGDRPGSLSTMRRNSLSRPYVTLYISFIRIGAPYLASKSITTRERLYGEVAHLTKKRV